ncbi:MAG: hypothetical protein ACYYK0_01015 [Candidatus Eutrophobiaceae bacterium]
MPVDRDLCTARRRPSGTVQRQDQFQIARRRWLHTKTRKRVGVVTLHCITSLVAIDPCTPENGLNRQVGIAKVCSAMLCFWTRMHCDYQICPIAEPGDVIFFDSFTPHRSKLNNSHQVRRVLYLT